MSMATGHTDAVVAKQVLVCVSQQAVPWLLDGQLFWQSLSLVQLGVHTLARSGFASSEASVTR